jgi:hypothetical protein
MAASHTHLSTGIGGWTIGDEITRLTRFRADDGTDIQVWGNAERPLPGLGAVGVGLDHENRVWLVNQQSATAVRLDSDTGETREYPVGVEPYTYSDFTGYVLRTFTAPNGTYRAVIPGCAMGITEWEYVSWRADTPGASTVEVRMRSARNEDALLSASWVGPYTESPADLTLAPGPVDALQFLEIELQLIADGSRTPRVQDLTVQYNCPI